MAQSTDLSNLDNQVAQVNGTGAVSLPQGTNSQRPKHVTPGMLRWNTSTAALELYGPTAWNSILNKQDIEDAYVKIAEPKFEGDLDAGGHKLSNVAAPAAPTDVVNLAYLEGRFTAGTGINADTLDGHDSLYFATQYDVTDLQNLVAEVQDNLNDHIADKENPHETTKAQVGLDQVDNTSDEDKPLSKAARDALYGSPATGTETTNPKGKVNRAGDTMQGALSMGYNNLMDIMNFVGSIWYFARENPPAGFLVCNGAAVSRTNYSRLFSIIGTRFGAGDGSTTFNLPDLRGMFVRGWALGGYPTDPGRVLGSYQPDDFLSHNHPLTDAGHSHTGSTNSAGSHFHEMRDGGGGEDTDGIASRKNFAAQDYATSWYSDPNLVKPAGDHTHTVTIAPTTTGITIAAAGGSETRPKNVAMLACIMY
ncbi:Phage Tail Collar Domain protein [compost metagenome]